MNTRSEHDPTLIECWLQGEEHAVRTIFSIYYPRAVRLAVLNGLSSDEAQDCAQNAFVRAFEKRRQLRNTQAFPLWFQRIVSSQIMNHFTATKNRAISLTTIEMEDIEIPTQGATLDEHMIVQESLIKLNQNIQKMSPLMRMVLILRYHEDLSLPEIAHTLGKREGAIRVILHRALKQLREQRQQQDNSFQMPTYQDSHTVIPSTAYGGAHKR